MNIPPPIGWPLLPLPDQDGRLAWPAFEQSVAEQIRVILLTRPPELLLRPDYGAGLEDFIHEPNNTTTQRRIQEAVVSALNRWEKRILLDDVTVKAVPERPTQVRVEISYRLRRTGAGRRTGLTLELTP